MTLDLVSVHYSQWNSIPMVYNNTHSPNSQYRVQGSRSIVHDLSLSNSSEPDPNHRFTRDLAWCIAPTLLVSFKYAWAGVRYAFVTQRNFRIHTLIGTVAITLAIWLELTPVEIAVIGLTSGLVMTLELLNTAVEAVVDLTVKQSYHKLAKVAKDCAAGAVLISAIAALLVAGSLLLPPLITRILLLMR